MNSSQNHQKDVTTILAYLKDIASAVMYAAEAEDLDQVLERISDVARELVNAKYAALGVPDGKGGLSHFKYVGLNRDQAVEIGHLPAGKGLLGAIMRERATIRLPDMQRDLRSVGFPAHHPNMKRFLGVPIQTGDQLFGMLYMCDRMDGEPFTEQDAWLVETLAGYAALAIAGSVLAMQKQRLTLLEERERIGMALHDGVIQSLYAVGMQLELMRTVDTNVPSSELRPIVNTLNDIIEDIRSYILNLKAQNYHQKTIRQCLQEIVVRLLVPEKVTVHIDAPDEFPPFTPSAFEGICAIVNEAMSNALRHSNASLITLTAKQLGHDFMISVVDNGDGFALSDLQDHQGLGLHNIKQRAYLQGGSVTIESQPQRGTSVTLHIPVHY